MAHDFEEERNKLLQANTKLEQRIREIQPKSEENRGSSESLISMVSSAFAKRGGSGSPLKPIKQGADAEAPLESSLKDVCFSFAVTCLSFNIIIDRLVDTLFFCLLVVCKRTVVLFLDLRFTIVIGLVRESVR